MQTNRRDLLKLFGVGATILPVVDSKPVEEAAATLVEVPKVELVVPEVLSVRGPMVQGPKIDLTVNMTGHWMEVRWLSDLENRNYPARIAMAGETHYGYIESFAPGVDMHSLFVDMRVRIDKTQKAKL